MYTYPHTRMTNDGCTAVELSAHAKVLYTPEDGIIAHIGDNIYKNAEDADSLTKDTVTYVEVENGIIYVDVSTYHYEDAYTDARRYKHAMDGTFLGFESRQTYDGSEEGSSILINDTFDANGVLLKHTRDVIDA